MSATYSKNLHLSYLSEQDVRLFLKEPKTSSAFSVGKGILVTAVLALGGYGILNYNALLRIYTPTENVQAVAATQPVSATPIPQPITQNSAVAVAPIVSSTIPENSISIPSVDVAAPITWDTSFDEETIQKKLHDGVVHLNGAAHPGQKGYVIVTGHSSNYPWIKGQYNTIFAPLHKAKLSDKIVINYDNIEYIYTISKLYQVKPSELSVLSGNSNGGIRLITCTPVGTSLRRLVVEAVQTSPSTDQNTDFTQHISTDTIPAAR